MRKTIRLTPLIILLTLGAVPLSAQSRQGQVNAELGALNSIQLSHDVFAPRRVIVYLNRYDDGRDIHLRNLAWLREVCGMDVVTDIEDLVRRLTQEDG